jgi:hypothetical protein
LISIYSWIVASQIDINDSIEVFRFGVLYACSFTYYLGCLIISSRFYAKGVKASNYVERYILFNMIAIFSFIAGMFFGSIYLPLGVIQKMAGSLFAFWCIEKWIEIDWSDKSWSWGVTGTGALLYALSYFVSNYPEFFLYHF